ncbi:hypothetical protein V500_11057 [Pseudogymnoascus sp. VKM F-4518 (FW-2643)]|nr:hypothetical protein V500_11057 [Pseudogymnoascus sp. VKM F-4518 (FW-2643)]
MNTLQRAASLVKPLIRAHNFKVGLLAEFLPKERALLGLNTGGGRTIHVRLRHATDPTQFFTFQMIMDTVLHELSHNRFGPHDASFHALWDQLRDEFSALMQSGFTGDAFLSQGHLVSGKRIRQDEVQRIARTAITDSRKKLPLTVNRKLGGAGLKPIVDVGSTITGGGAFGRMQIAQGCGCDMPKSEQKALVAAASVNVMKSRVEKDDASEVAIQEALWELAQEDRASSSKPTGASYDSAAGKVGSLPTNRPSSSHAYDASSKSPKPYDSDSEYSEDPSLSKPPPQYVQLVDEEFWQCETCTLINKEEDVCCDACGAARPGTEPPPKATSSKIPAKAAAKKTPYKAPPAKSSTRARPSSSRAGPSRQAAKSGAWQCSCSLINKEGRVCCAACGISRPGS